MCSVNTKRLYHALCCFMARTAQQVLYARRVCVPWVKAAQIMRDIMRDSISLTLYYARSAWRKINDRGLVLKK